MNKLLFIAHETSRTGAPMVLLYFLQWLKKHYPHVESSLLVMKSGDLQHEFDALVTDVYRLDAQKLTIQERLYNKFGNKKDKRSPFFKLTERLGAKNFDLIYSNSVVASSLGNTIKQLSLNSKHIVHVHEMRVIIDTMRPDFKEIVPQIDHFIAVSNLVKQHLTEQWSIESRDITKIYECSEVNHVMVDKPSKKEFVVGASGVVTWRKGYDLFLQVARYIRDHFPEQQVKFVWVGKMPSIEAVRVEEELRKAKLNEMVTFVGDTLQPMPYFQDFDVFLMTSREDPFPLVCIEVGQLGKPIICFTGATGTQEIVAQGGGFCVPYLNVEAMAEKVVYYKENPAVKAAHGVINKEQFQRFTPEKTCPLIFDVIKTVLDETT